jgi:hypothetical protein
LPGALEFSAANRASTTARLPFLCLFPAADTMIEPPAEESQRPTAGHMIVLPVGVTPGMKITHMVPLMLPWAAPRVLATYGYSAEDEPALGIVMEWPITWLRTVEPLPKFDHELLLLRRFSSDQAIVTGRHAYGHLKPGADPPDATAITDAGTIGVESTALTAGDRRRAHGLFTALRRRVQEQEPAAFTKLSGHTVYVWFDTDEAPVGLPHRRSDEDAIRELVQALADYEPKTEELRHDGQPPETLPDLALHETDAGAKFYAAPIFNAVPNTMLFTLAGFELGLGYTSYVTPRKAWEEIQRLVDSHDKPGVDLLVITAGGPDLRGMIFPAEGVLATFILANPIGLTRAPNHIGRVLLHWWGTGEAAVLHPTVEQLFPGPYEGLTPSHHPIEAIESPNIPAADSE